MPTQKLILMTLVCVLVLPLSVPSVDAQSDQQLALAGLLAPVAVRYDQMGIPHIYAENSHDLFLAQGYVEASQRWWQMEWWRHLSAGRWAEIGGEELLSTDRHYRRFNFTRYAEQDIAALSDEARAALDAYTQGVNAYLADKTPAEAAIEYEWLALAGISLELEPWTINDSVRWVKMMAASLSENYNTELARAEIIEQVGPVVANLLVPPYPYDIHPVIMEPGAIDFSVALETAALPDLALPQPLAEAVYFSFGQGTGSNAWVVSGTLTDTGLPYLANDPHLSIQMPSIWLEVGLHCIAYSEACPYDVVGVSFAGVPGVVIGHNQRVAWGFTNAGVDVQDAYILTLNPDNPLQYQYNGEWVDFVVREEVFGIANGEPRTISMYDSVWGPVMEMEDDYAIALRWTAFDPNTSLDAFLALNRAQNWEDFRQAASLFDVPAQNMLYADVDGNIGYQLPGQIPIRADGHTGKVPIDGSRDAYSWQGYIPFEELPSLYNPEAGYIVTANNRITGPDYPYPLIDVYSYGWRAARIEALLQTADGPITRETMATIQGDNYNLKADFLIPALQALSTDDPAVQQAIVWLGEWNRQNHMDSPQAALFEVFWVELLRLTLVDDLGSAPAGGGDLEWYLLLQLVDMPSNQLWDYRDTADVVESRDETLALALAGAWDLMTAYQGDDPALWNWGDLHTATFEASPLGWGGFDPTLDPILQSLFNVTVRTSGGDSIVNATGWNANKPYAVTQVPSMRQILNPADWDASLRINTVGQSGDPRSPHYRDQVEQWTTIEYHPDWYNLAAVEADTQATWVLVPEE